MKSSVHFPYPDPVSYNGIDQEDTEIYHHKELLKRLPGNEDLIPMLIERFLQEIPAYLVDLQEALDKEDAASIFRLAHTIKGSAANLSCKKLEKVSKEIEIAAREERLSSAREMMPELLHVFSQSRNVLLDHM